MTVRAALVCGGIAALLAIETATAQTDRVYCFIRMESGGTIEYELSPGIQIWTEAAVRKNEPNRRATIRIYPERKRPVWVAKQFPGAVALVSLDPFNPGYLPSAEFVLIMMNSASNDNPALIKAGAVLIRRTEVIGHGACSLV